MTLKEILGIMRNYDLLRIVKDGQDVYVGYLGLLIPGCGHDENEIYEKLKNDEVERIAILDEVKHKHWNELDLEKPLLPENPADYEFKDLQLTIYRVIYLKGQEDENKKDRSESLV